MEYCGDMSGCDGMGWMDLEIGWSKVSSIVVWLSVYISEYKIGFVVIVEVLWWF